MNDVPPISIQRTTLGRVEGQRAAQNAATSQPQRQGQGDSVELSPMANLLTRLNELPETREDLVQRVKSEIQAGQYETPQKLDSAVQQMAEEEALF
jgi:anti-sigma28 factor (negative regulator of flagellin synthesis)